jgi:hypothetical protein
MLLAAVRQRWKPQLQPTRRRRLPETIQPAQRSVEVELAPELRKLESRCTMRLASF